MISKELLSEVLDEEVIKIGKITNNNNLWYGYNDMGDTSNFINIHELAHKCKEWVLKTYGYILNSNSNGYCDICDTGIIAYKLADTEPEAIFKACEWILAEKENK